MISKKQPLCGCFFAEASQKGKFALAKFHPRWYNVHSYWIWRQIVMISITAAQFFFGYYYFFMDKK